jgi:hypothetical protein
MKATLHIAFAAVLMASTPATSKPQTMTAACRDAKVSSVRGANRAQGNREV